MENEKIERFKKLVTGEDSSWAEAAKWRSENKGWLQKSAAIALKVLRILREKGISQKDLAERLSISAQQVSKILKGNENLTLETITKLENALEIKLIEIPSYTVTEERILEVPRSFRYNSVGIELTKVQTPLLKYKEVAVSNYFFSEKNDANLYIAS